jgi:hypothetical protein
VGFWKRESLHERLAREGGLEFAQRPEPRAPWDLTGVHGLHRPREWDDVAMAQAPGLQGDTARFVTLADGSLLVEEAGEGDLSPLADALSLQAPYRAEAIRREGAIWAVAARKLEVVELDDDVEGDELVLAATDDERTLTVDGLRTFGSIPALERLGEQRYDAYVVHAQRLDGRLWEVKVTPL